MVSHLLMYSQRIYSALFNFYTVSLQRKSQNIFGSNQDNFFDSLASASTATSGKIDVNTNDWMKMKKEVV